MFKSCFQFEGLNSCYTRRQSGAVTLLLARDFHLDIDSDTETIGQRSFIYSSLYFFITAVKNAISTCSGSRAQQNKPLI